MLSSDRLALEAELARRSFRYFIERFWGEVESAELVHEAYVDRLAEALQAVGDGKVSRVAINVAPGLGKSLIASVLLPCWLWVRDSSRRIITASYSFELGCRDSSRSRRLLQSTAFRQMFPNIEILADENSRHRFSLATGGSRHVVSTSSATTGFRADAIVCDDPLSAGDAFSEAARSTCLSWFSESLLSRLNSPESPCVLIAQRLHSDDLFSHLGPHWQRVVLPMIAPDGTLLSPTRWPAAALEQVRTELGTAGFECQYQQNPSVAGSGMLNPSWFPRFDKEPEVDFKIVSADLSFKSGGDANCFTCLGRQGSRIYVLDVLASNKWEFPATCQALENFVTKHSPNMTILEDAANGAAAFATLKPKIPGLFLQRASTSKEERCAAWSPRAESGDVWLPTEAPWLAYALKEITEMPGGKHDDFIDALGLGLSRLRQSREAHFTPMTGRRIPRIEL